LRCSVFQHVRFCRYTGLNSIKPLSNFAFNFRKKPLIIPRHCRAAASGAPPTAMQKLRIVILGFGTW
jgi:hypothetical protein